MQPLANSVDPTAYKQELASQLFKIEITSHCHGPSLVFADTSILLWMYRLNDNARNELLLFLNGLIDEERLRIPAWVIHEYNSKVEKIGEIIHRPLATLLRSAKSKLDELHPHVSMLASEEFVAGTDFESKDEFLGTWEKTKSQFDRLFRVLSQAQKKQSRNARQDIYNVLQKAALDTDVFSLLSTVEKEGRLRYSNRLAPGYMDLGKDINTLGDFVIWKEILQEASQKRSSAVLLSHDRKPDWVYTPQYLDVQDGSKRPNDGNVEPKITLPQPFLSAEFALRVGSDFSFHIAGMEALTQLLGSNIYNPGSHEKYGNLINALALDSENSPTHNVIGWFLNNPDLLREAIHGAAYWDRCPSKISIEELKEFVANNCPNTVLSDVSWDTVIMELFI